MQVAFRTDAALHIGTGHVMRCLALADALTARGAKCHFICREHAGNLIKHIWSKGFATHSLPMCDTTNTDLAHGQWLGATQTQDAEACARILANLMPDWLIVDHYALDARWERTLAPYYKRLMVIDDLADRAHVCHLLLDQTFGRMADDYCPWVPADSHVICGSKFALLRPEFAALRCYSLQRRTHPRLKQLLITMGGVDKNNATGQVLIALRECSLPAGCSITVVMGTTAPWLNEVRQQARAMPWPTHVQVGVKDMARLMADSDLAIGAAGATSWERCCLGLPTAMLVLSENQQHAAMLLEKANAARMLQLDDHLPTQLSGMIDEMTQSDTYLRQLSDGARVVTDGNGSQLIANHLTSEIVNE